ncbi:response regulator [Alicyclobacillus herbarius]|uniref:response regulator n=1 Tax=Alicyclobacillus herbarius TaxID=122960 RepID=UPI000415D995|nr:response regulator transcription factor [Alicyclobacillus herbarius]
MIRLLIVDDQRLMRDGLKTLLGSEPDIEVAAVAADGTEAVELVQQNGGAFDVILMDVRMPNLNGIEATSRIKQICPQARIVMLTTFDEQEEVVGALQAGAVGYLVKDMPAEEIAQAVRAANAGGAVLPPGIASKLLSAIQAKGFMTSPQGDNKGEPRAPQPAADIRLTEREEDVLDCLARGMSNREIAAHLFVTEGTVKNHVSNLIAKLNLRDRTQVALYAVKHGYGGTSFKR